MTYTFKLARRIARLRAPLAVAFLAALTACGSDEPFDPNPDFRSYDRIATADPDAPTAGWSSTGTQADYASLPTGKLMGMPRWPTSRWSEPPFTLTIVTVPPRDLPDQLDRARRANLPILVGLPRSAMTSTGSNQGRFDLGNALGSVDQLARVLTPDTVRKYLPWIRGIYSVDEPFCDGCYDGRPATYDEVVRLLGAMRQKIDPGHLIPMVIRVQPSKLDDYGDFNGLVDVAWVVYKLGGKLTARETLDQEWEIARRKGWKMIAGLNAEDCFGVGSRPCTASEIRTHGEPIVRHEGVCAMSSWHWDEDTWSQSSIREAWAYVAGVARSLPTTTCGRAVSGGQTPPPPPPPSAPTTRGTVARIDIQPNTIGCAPGRRVGVTARAYDASGAELAVRVHFRVTDDAVIGVARTGDRTATVSCLRRGSSYVVAGQDGVRDRSPVRVQ